MRPIPYTAIPSTNLLHLSICRNSLSPSACIDDLSIGAAAPYRRCDDEEDLLPTPHIYLCSPVPDGGSHDAPHQLLLQAALGEWHLPLRADGRYHHQSQSGIKPKPLLVSSTESSSTGLFRSSSNYLSLFFSFALIISSHFTFQCDIISKNDSRGKPV